MPIIRSQVRIVGRKLLTSIVVVLLVACQKSTVTPETTSELTLTTGPEVSTRVPETAPLFSIDDECPPPCWEGLIPGISAREEAGDLIHMPPLSEWLADNNCPSDSYLLMNQEINQEGFSMIVINIDENDIVESIQGYVDGEVLVSDIINLMGEPTLIIPGRPISECTHCSERSYPMQESDELISDSFVIYPEQGVYYEILLDARDWGCVCPEMRLTWFCYLEPQFVDGLIDPSVIVDACAILETSVEEFERAGPWQGYAIPN